MLTPQVEPLTYRIIKDCLIKTPEAVVHALGGTDTHVHVAVTIPPLLLPSTFIGFPGAHHGPFAPGEPGRGRLPEFELSNSNVLP